MIVNPPRDLKKPPPQLSVHDLRTKLSKAVTDAEHAMANWTNLKRQVKEKYPDDPAQRLTYIRDKLIFAEAREDYRFALERVTLYSEALQGLGAVSTIAAGIRDHAPTP